MCQVSVRHARGPKKGHMAALKKKIAELEGRLASQDAVEDEESMNSILDFPGDQNILDWNNFHDVHLQTGNNTSVAETEASFSNFVATTAAQSIPVTTASLTSTPVTSAASAPMPATPVMSVSMEPEQLHTLTGFIPAELDQLYFERIHPAIPLLHQRSYLSWSKKDVKKKSQICVQRAMWALAALQSSQYRYLQEQLYRSCTQMLTAICSSSAGYDPFDREQIQAWLLITIYELMRSFHRQAWMSVGRAFRLVQLLRLHELDNPSHAVTPAHEGFVEKEEERRAFWLAYFLDHLFGISSNWPITLNELVVCTRLPAFEDDFQNERPVLGSFLSEAITEQPRYQSPFNEAIIFVTLCGRWSFYRQQDHVRSAYGDIYSNWTHSALMLDNILRQRLKILSQCYSSPDEASGQMIHFVNTMAQISVIYSSTGADMLLRVDEGNPMQEEYKLRAIAAVDQIIKLAQVLTKSFVFKIHPLAAIPLMLCADFLFTNQFVSEKFSSLLERLSEVFEQIRDIEDPTQSYIDVMRRWQCSAKVGGRLRRPLDDSATT